MGSSFELIYIVSVLIFVLGGGTVFGVLFFYDRKSKSDHLVDVLPHEKDYSEREAKLASQKDAA